MSSKKGLRTRISPKSIRFRLTIFFVSFLTLTLITFSTVLYQAIVTDNLNEFDDSLYNYATDISRSIDITLFGGLTIEKKAIWDRQKIFPFQVGDTFLQIISREPRILARSRSLGHEVLPFNEAEIKRLSSFQAVFKTIDWKKKNYRMIMYPIEKSGSSELVLMIGVPQILLDEQNKNLFNFFLFAIPFTLIIVAIGGFYLSGRVIAPASTIIERASKISATELSARLPVPPVQDEIYDLSMTLNNLLDRLEQAFKSQERFVSDASHQLKTPIAIIQGELDVLQSRERSQAEIDEFLKSAKEELRYLSKIVDNLLSLARVDAGKVHLHFREVRLDEVVLEVVSLMEGLAFKKHIKIRFDIHHPGDSMDAGVTVEGDHELLKTMVQNLLENAIKYSNENGSIEVELDTDGDHRQLRVRNFGQIIPEAEIEHVFKRFYRVADQRDRSRGVGIGLALVKRIAEVHGGTVSVKSSLKSGTCFQVDIKNF